MTGDDWTYDEDAVYALSHQQRREIVETLCENGPCSLLRLAYELSDGRGLSVATVLVELHDIHIPKLQSCGLITYDPETRVTLIQSEEKITDLLTDLEEQ